MTPGESIVITATSLTVFNVKCLLLDWDASVRNGWYIPEKKKNFHKIQSPQKL